MMAIGPRGSLIITRRSTMKAWKTLLGILGIALPLGAQVHLGGYLETYQRYWVHADSGRWTWNENRLQIQLEATPAENLHFYTELRLRGLGFPQVHSLEDLQGAHKDPVYPWSLEIREAYADLYDFGLSGLDVRIGRQVIAWGTADKINPTSNLSPYDFEDFFDFGAKLGVNALRATYTRDPWSLEVDLVPVFTPATLPPAGWSAGFLGFPGATAGIPLHLRVSIPSPEIQNTQLGLKLSTTLLDWDLSLSYYRGFDGLPLPDTLLMTPNPPALQVHLRYPKIQVVGADVAGALGSVGLWAEAALFVPEDFVQQAPWGLDTVLQDPYLKAVIGGDYTFRGGLYVHAQYVHGFLHERGDSLHDYLVARLEKKFHNDELTLAPLGVAATVGDWDDVGHHYGIAWIPEVKYTPTDNLELRLGAFVLHGEGANLFAALKEHDEVFFRVKVSW